MNPISQAIETLFEHQGWKFTKHDDFRYTFGFRTGSNRFDLYALIGEQRNTLCIYAKIPLQAPHEMLLQTAEYVSRANWDMTLGNFELDFRDGEIRFKTSLNFRDREPDPEDVHDMIDCALAMADRYYPGFGALIYGGQTAEAAVHMVESQ